MTDNTPDILEKISAAHLRGEHTLGAFAGCELCQATTLPPAPPAPLGISGEGVEENTDPLGLLSALGAVKPEERKVVPIFKSASAPPPPPPSPSPAGDTLGDVALIDAQTALDLVNTARVYGNPATWSEAQISTSVGILRAIVGVEQQLQTIAYLLARAEEDRKADHGTPAA